MSSTTRNGDTGRPRIGTHNGQFHVDEILACVMLKQLPEYAKHEIFRTRDPIELAKCALVVDVGGVFDPTTHHYDHHQRYSINTGLSSRVGGMNPKWNEENPDEMVSFMRAFDVVQSEFLSTVHYYAHTWYPARDLVDAALKSRHEVDPSGHIISLENQSCPWRAHLYELEKLELADCDRKHTTFDLTQSETTTDRPVFCIYRRDNGDWGVQAIAPSEKDSFKNRVSLPETWRGLRDEELSKVIGKSGGVFVHSTGFLGIHHTREGALHMARISLKMANLPCSITSE